MKKFLNILGVGLVVIAPAWFLYAFNHPNAQSSSSELVFMGVKITHFQYQSQMVVFILGLMAILVANKLRRYKESKEEHISSKREISKNIFFGNPNINQSDITNISHSYNINTPTEIKKVVRQVFDEKFPDNLHLKEVQESKETFNDVLKRLYEENTKESAKALQEIKETGKVDQILIILKKQAEEEEKHEAQTKLISKQAHERCIKRFMEIVEIAYLHGANNEANKAIEAILTKDPEHLRALTYKGHIHLFNWDFDEAEWVYLEVLEIAQKKSLRTQEAAALGNLGVVYYRQLRLNEARKKTEESLTKYPLDDKIAIAKTKANLGLIEAAQGKHAIAINKYKEALKTFEDFDLKEEMASTYGNLGNSYARLEEFHFAIDAYENAVILNKKLGNRRGEANSLSNIGIVHCEKKEWQLGLKMFRESLNIFRKLPQPKGIADTVMHIANVISEAPKQKIKLAFRLYECALEFYKSKNLKLETANTIMNIASARLQNGQPTESVDLYQEAEKIYEDLVRKRGVAKDSLAIVRVNLGIVFKINRQYVEAEKYWLSAQELFNECGMLHKVKILQGWINDLEKEMKMDSGSSPE